MYGYLVSDLTIEKATPREHELQCDEKKTLPLFHTKTPKSKILLEEKHRLIIVSLLRNKVVLISSLVLP